MKPNRVLWLLALCLFVIAVACNKDNDSNNVTPVKPDLSVKKTTSVTGFVTDENDAPLAGVQVKAGDKETSTDEYGYFSIAQVSLPEVAAFVKITKAGYFDNYKTFTADEEHPAFVRTSIIPKKEAGSLEASSGGSVKSADGVTVILPADGVVVTGSTVPYSGKVHVNIKDIASLPGDGRGTDKDGYLALLTAYSGIAVELTGNTGQRLQIAPGKNATINMPVPTALLSQAPASVSLWSLDESTGLWKLEGKAVKTGNEYVASVSHFSFWSAAIGYPLVNLTARVLNTAAQPLVNVPVVVTVAGQPVNAGYSQFAWTDANGYVSGPVPANTSLVLNILTPCNTAAYSHNFTTTNTDADLGDVTGNLGQGMVTISGTAKDCNNASITNGYIQTYDNGFYNRINIVNGSFSFTGLACTNTTVQYVAVNKGANKQNEPQEITLAPGVNDVGEIVACGINSFGSITYSVNSGTSTSLVEPTDTLGAYYFPDKGGTTSIITLSGAQSGNSPFSFQISGGAETGANHKVTEVFANSFPGGRVYAPAPLTVTITEYGKPGGFIAGNFSGLMLGFSDNSIQNINLSFRVRRMN